VTWTADPFDRLERGAALRTAARTITETDLVSFSALTGDWHPAHSDVRAAAAGPFGERVAHGMLLLAYAMGQLPLQGSAALALREVRHAVFKRPAPIGTTMHVDAVVGDMQALDDETGLIDLDLSIMGDDELLLVRAGLRLLWRREPALR
jgi:3-hydroxybutyryl-CoA dehydratase